MDQSEKDLLNDAERTSVMKGLKYASQEFFFKLRENTLCEYFETRTENVMSRKRMRRSRDASAASGRDPRGP